MAMAVSMISGYGQIQNIYAFRSTHFNQVQDMPVTPVSKTQAAPTVSEDEDRTLWAATRTPIQEQAEQLEASAVEKQTGIIKDSFNGEALQYDLSNPYEAVRMSMDNMLVAGMNINVMA